MAVELDYSFAAELNQHYLVQRAGMAEKQLSNKGQLLPDQTLLPETGSQGLTQTQTEMIVPVNFSH